MLFGVAPSAKNSDFTARLRHLPALFIYFFCAIYFFWCIYLRHISKVLLASIWMQWGLTRLKPPAKESQQRFISRTCISDPKSARAQAKLKETTCKMESKEQTNKNPTKIGLGEMLDSSLSAVTEQCQEPSCSSCWIPRCFHQCYATL